MSTNVKTFDSSQEVANAFTARLIQVNEQAKQSGSVVTVCLSGGSTPKLFFKTLAADHGEVDWSRVHFFWGDERCVPAASDESNFGEADRLFLSQASIPDENVHAVNGTIDPELAAKEYAAEIQKIVKADGPDGLPRFDLMVLGMGDDGHTASIFPHQMQLLDSKNICDVATHPTSGQKRVTVTGQVIRNSAEICFLVTGANKADVLATILNRAEGHEAFPTSHFSQLDQTSFWLDQAAAAKL